ncbi:MAG TPA: hypothetical protein VK550_16170 [Polyangiaceae bacterium]|nr:hypothetical protein [Polyangiaceae bacterium]
MGSASGLLLDRDVHRQARAGQVAWLGLLAAFMLSVACHAMPPSSSKGRAEATTKPIIRIFAEAVEARELPPPLSRTQGNIQPNASAAGEPLSPHCDNQSPPHSAMEAIALAFPSGWGLLFIGAVALALTGLVAIAADCHLLRPPARALQTCGHHVSTACEHLGIEVQRMLSSARRVLSPTRRAESLTVHPLQLTPDPEFPGVPVLVRCTLGPGAVVRYGRKSHVLGSVVNSGGEGEILNTSDPTLLVKLYFPQTLTTGRRKKLEYLLRSKLPQLPANIGEICWPLDLVFDEDGAWRGFVMRRGKGDQLFSVNKRLKPTRATPLERHAAARFQVARNLATAVATLHRVGILAGDLNDENFLVDGAGRVFLIDTDSYQVAGFPSPVARAEYLPAELQNKNLEHVLRTLDSERFACAVLLFTVLMGGVHPFRRKGSSTPQRDIASGIFPYPHLWRSGAKAPAGIWKDVWLTLPFFVRAAFVRTFAGNTRGKRPPIEAWATALARS